MRTDAAARADQQQQPQRVTRSRGPDKAAASEASRLIVKKDAHAKDGASSDKSAVRSPQNFGSNDDEVPVAPEAARRSVEEDTRPNTPALEGCHLTTSSRIERTRQDGGDAIFSNPVE